MLYRVKSAKTTDSGLRKESTKRLGRGRLGPQCLCLEAILDVQYLVAGEQGSLATVRGVRKCCRFRGLCCRCYSCDAGSKERE